MGGASTNSLLAAPAETPPTPDPSPPLATLEGGGETEAPALSPALLQRVKALISMSQRRRFNPDLLGCAPLPPRRKPSLRGAAERWGEEAGDSPLAPIPPVRRSAA